MLDFLKRCGYNELARSQKLQEGVIIPNGAKRTFCRGVDPL